MSITEVWSSCDYSPTAQRLAPAAQLIFDLAVWHLNIGQRVLDIGAGHGHLTQLLTQMWPTTALEPVAGYSKIGKRRCPKAKWVTATGERTGLRAGSHDAIVSNFGSFLCDPRSAAEEWSRVLTPDGFLAFTAWDSHGFIADLESRMLASLSGEPKPSQPPYMTWGDPGVAEQRLEPYFTDIQITRHQLPWQFTSVEQGMELYFKGSPTHAYAIAKARNRRPELLNALLRQLEENADETGAVQAKADYVLITATVAN